MAPRNRCGRLPVYDSLVAATPTAYDTFHAYDRQKRDQQSGAFGVPRLAKSRLDSVQHTGKPTSPGQTISDRTQYVQKPCRGVRFLDVLRVARFRYFYTR